MTSLNHPEPRVRSGAPFRHVVRTVATCAALLLALTACGSGDADESADAVRTVDHAFGTTTLTGAPQRIVTLGWVESDIVTALGLEPVGMSAFPFSESGVSPWLEPKLSGKPELFGTARAGAEASPLSVEEIVGAAPDLIIATTFVDLDRFYDQLSDIAPVLGPADRDYSKTTWQDQVRTIGRALDRADRAEQLVADTERLVTDAAAQLPELSGRSYTLSLATPVGLRAVQNPRDYSVELLGRFGLRPSERIAALPGLNDGSGGAGVAEEVVDVIDADVVLVGYPAPPLQPAWEAKEIFRRIPAVADGRYAALTAAQITALRNASPYAIGYAVDDVVRARLAPLVRR